MQRIQLTKLFTKVTSDGKIVMNGRLMDARIQIEALPEPDERGATHAVYILPPKDRTEEKRWKPQARGEAQNTSHSGELLGFSSWCEPEVKP